MAERDPSSPPPSPSSPPNVQGEPPENIASLPISIQPISSPKSSAPTQIPNDFRPPSPPQSQTTPSSPSRFPQAPSLPRAPTFDIPDSSNSPPPSSSPLRAEPIIGSPSLQSQAPPSLSNPPFPPNSSLPRAPTFDLPDSLPSSSPPPSPVSSSPLSSSLQTKPISPPLKSHALHTFSLPKEPSIDLFDSNGPRSQNFSTAPPLPTFLERPPSPQPPSSLPPASFPPFTLSSPKESAVIDDLSSKSSSFELKEEKIIPEIPLDQSFVDYDLKRQDEDEEKGNGFEEFTLRSTSVVVATFLQQFIILGNLYSFGVFQSEYEREFPDESSADIALIGSIQAGILPTIGILSGMAAERFGRRRMVLVGTILLAISYLIASSTDSFTVLYLSQGALSGISMSLAYFSATTTVPSWFDKRRGLATGIATAGSGTGGFVFAPTIAFLFTQYDRPTVLRILTVINLTGQLVTLPFLITKQEYEEKKQKDDEKKSKVEPITIMDVSGDPIYWCFVGGCFILGFAYYTPFFYLPKFAMVNGMSRSYGAFILGVVNLSSACGRISWGQLGDILGSSQSLAVSIFCSAVACYLWVWCTTHFTLFLFACLFGFGVGGFISLVPTAIADIWGVGALGQVFGSVFSATSVGNLIGPALFGKMIEYYSPSFWETQVATGTIFMDTVAVYLILISLYRQRMSSIPVVD